jgi:cardiolipin synthase (CMP-forming)
MPVNAPNLITICRILLVPITVWLILSSAFDFAFGVFVLAGLTDAVDGFLARRFQLQTDLGAMLDPIADKALLVSIFVALGTLGHLPAWLVILVVTRDILIIGAVVISWVMDRPIPMKPLWISKVNTAGQIILAGATLATLGFSYELGRLLATGIGLTAALTAASGAIYMRDWIRHMSSTQREGSR